MNPTRKLLAVAAAALGTAAIAAPVSSASAATRPGVAPNLAGWVVPWGDYPSFVGAPVYVITLAGPSVGQTAAVVGPTITTTAPSSFINTNNQVSAGSTVSGGQVTAP